MSARFRLSSKKRTVSIAEPKQEAVGEFASLLCGERRSWREEWHGVQR